MNPERIAEIAKSYSTYIGHMMTPKHAITEAINQALEEQTRWFYIDEGELPRKGEYVIVSPPYISNAFPDEPRHVLQYDCDRFQHYLGGSVHIVPINKVKSWTYLPVMEE